MNSIILNLIAPGASAKADVPADIATKTARRGHVPFGLMLAGKLRAVAGLPGSATPATATAETTSALETKIAKLIGAGKSESQIISTLADELAASVAAALGLPPGSASRAQLSAVFTKALGPPGATQESGDDLARTLAQRFLKLQTVAAQIIDANSGQQNRIAGTFLDAKPAKETPAPTQNGINTTASADIDDTATSSDVHRTARQSGGSERVSTPALGTPRPPADVAARQTPTATVGTGSTSDAASQAAADAAATLASANAAASLASANGSVSLASTNAAVSLASANGAASLASTNGAASLASAAVVHVTASGSMAHRIAPAAFGAIADEGDFANAPRRAPAPAAGTNADGVAAATAGGIEPAALAASAQSFTGVRDGRTVKVGNTPALSTGGDTSLGRILTRAVSAAALRETPNAAPPTPVAVTPAASTGVNSMASTAPLIDQSSDASQAPIGAPAPTGALAAFVKSFEAALGVAPAAAPAHSHTDAAGTMPLALALPQTADASTAFVPAVAPFTIERAAPVQTPALPVYATPVDQSAIVDQVLRGAFARNTGASSEMRLSLVPETLGDVNIKLVVTAGVVTAHVVAQTPEVRDALVAAQPQLTKSLADAGLKLEGFTVDLSGNGFAGFSQQRDQPNSNPPGRANGSADIAVDDVTDTTLDAVPSFGPSGSAAAGAYNYLA